MLFRSRIFPTVCFSISFIFLISFVSFSSFIVFGLKQPPTIHITKLVQITALLAVGAQASSSSAPASQDSTLEARAPDGYSRPADLFKFNWHIPKIPTWKELQEPADRYKHLQPAKPAANQPAKSPSKKAGRRSLENDEEPEQEERVEVKRAVAWSA